VSGPQRLLLGTSSIHELRSKRSIDPDTLFDGYEQSSGRPYDGQQKLEPNMVVTVEPGV
jgi:Xaa-Pro aminopeptidase